VVFNDTEITLKAEIGFYRYFHYRKLKMECLYSFTMFKFE